jgi:DNA polymerase III subunit delta'
MPDPILYPWLEKTWQHIQQRQSQDKLAHAFLFSGIEGLGKFDLARYFAKYLFCRQPENTTGACGHCKTCQLFEAGVLPDYHLIETLAESKEIKVDQIRKLCRALTLTPQIADQQIALIHSAEKMNLSAANSLLKSLEEPNGHTIFILVSDFPDQLPVTILSRCQQFKLHPPAKQLAVDWLRQKNVSSVEAQLALASGAPLAALEYAKTDLWQQRTQLFKDFLGLTNGQRDALLLSENWQKSHYPQCLSWLHSWTMDMIRLASDKNVSMLANNDLRDSLHVIVKKLDLKELFLRLDQVQRAIQIQKSTANPQMILDEVLIKWSLK